MVEALWWECSVSVVLQGVDDAPVVGACSQSAKCVAAAAESADKEKKSNFSQSAAQISRNANAR